MIIEHTFDYVQLLYLGSVKVSIEDLKRRKECESMAALDRVTTAQAAKELNTTVLDIQESLIQGLIPIGFAQMRRKSSRYHYVIYRGLLDAYKKQIRIVDNPASQEGGGGR